MKDDWKSCKIEDCVTLLGDGIHGTPKYCKGGEYAFINGNNLSNGFVVIKDDTKRVCKEEYEKYKKDLSDRTIFVSINGTIGNVAKYRQEKVILGKSACYLNVCQSVEKDFLYYVLIGNNFQKYLQRSATGTTIKNISLKQMREYEITLPPLPTQKKIAAVLSALDAKIENNNAINRNLEQQAQALFKSWFVDFEPFGGKMPEGWREYSLCEIAEFISGYSYTGKELKDHSQIGMATIKNFERNGGFKLEGFKGLLPQKDIKAEQYVDIFDCLVAHTDLTQNAEVIGNAEMLYDNAGYEQIVMSMDLVKVIPNNSNISNFLIGAMLKDKRFKQHALGYVNGTTVLHLSKKALKEYKLYLPKNLCDVKDISNLLEQLYGDIANRIKENTRLAALRDTLLPKLMSGEIEV